MRDPGQEEIWSRDWIAAVGWLFGSRIVAEPSEIDQGEEPRLPLAESPSPAERRDRKVA